jgi:hypothetical protein
LLRIDVMKWHKSPDALVQAFDHCLPIVAGVERKPMFGYPCAFVSGHLFCGLHGDGIIVRLPEARRNALTAEGAGVFEPKPGQAMKEYVVAPAAIVADRERLGALLGEALAYASSLASKPQKRSATKEKLAPERTAAPGKAAPAKKSAPARNAIAPKAPARKKTSVKRALASKVMPAKKAPARKKAPVKQALASKVKLAKKAPAKKKGPVKQALASKVKLAKKAPAKGPAARKAGTVGKRSR